MNELFDTLPDAVFVIDDRGIIQRVNAACERLVGYPPPELVGKSVELLVPDRHHNHDRLREGFHAAPSSRSMAMGSVLFAKRKDGTEVPVDISLSPSSVNGQQYIVAAMRDMSEQHRLAEVLGLQSLALEAAANGIIITDRDGVITWSNPSFSAMTGYDREEILGEHTRVLKSGAHEDHFYRELWQTVLAGQTWSGEIINRRRDGTLYHEEQLITPVLDPRGEISHFIAIKQDVTQRHDAIEALRVAHEELAAKLDEIELLNKRLHEQAIRDPLTGLFNRRYFEPTIERERHRMARADQPIAFVMIDLDHFKRVNDDYGHPVGDLVLQHVAGLLSEGVRGSDLLCRFGGEEFVVALPGAALEIAARRAEDWRARVEETVVEDNGHRIAMTMSAGVAVLAPGGNVEEALRRADSALYAAKREGRNRIVSDL